MDKDLDAEHPAEYIHRSKIDIIIAIIALFSFGLIFSSINRGLELSDESFYLYYAIKFDDMAASITPFGYLIHPFFLFLGSSIIALRLAGVAMLAITGAIFGFALTVYYRSAGRSWINWRLAVTVALCNLAYYAVWSLTPGYNLLILCAVELIGAGALFASRRTSTGARWIMTGGALIGAGAFLSFFAKPTVAALCAVAILPLFWCWWRWYGWRGTVARLATASITCGLLFAVTLSPNGRTAKLVSETTNGLKYLKLGNSPQELLVKTTVDIYRSSPFLWIVLAAFLTAFVLMRRSVPEARNGLRRVAIVVFAVAVAFLAINIASGLLQRQSPYLFVFLPTVCLIAGALLLLYARAPRALDIKLKDILVPAVLIFLPVMVSFGSSIAIFVQSGMYLPLTLIGAVVWFRLIRAGIYSTVAELAVVVSIPILLVWSMAFPFHQANSIFASDTAVPVGPKNDRLLVSSHSAVAIRALTAAGHDAGMNGRTPVVDLTGTGPSIALLVNGRAPFYPYIITALGQPRPLADQVWISMTDIERRAAWIVTPVDPKLVDALPAKYFEAHRRDYILAAHVDLPVYPGLARPLDVWKPVEPTREVARNEASPLF